MSEMLSDRRFEPSKRVFDLRSGPQSQRAEPISVFGYRYRGFSAWRLNREGFWFIGCWCWYCYEFDFLVFFSTELFSKQKRQRRCCKEYKERS